MEAEQSIVLRQLLLWQQTLLGLALGMVAAGVAQASLQQCSV